MDVVLHRTQRLFRLGPFGGRPRSFSTGVFPNRSNNVKGKQEKDASLAYVSSDIFLNVRLKYFIHFRFPMKMLCRKIVNLLC